jgi:hypothetical protein
VGPSLCSTSSPRLLPTLYSMSSPGSSPPQPPRQQTPHIRLNSGVDNILNSMHDTSNISRHPSSRSLTSHPRSNSALRPARSNRSLYQQPKTAGESTELLIPPTKSRTRHYRDEEPPLTSSISASSSRRTSWSSDSAGSRSSRQLALGGLGVGAFASPFDDSRAPSRAGSDDEVNTQTVSEKYNILPSAGLLLFPEDVEKDDYLHNPDPNDKDVNECDVWSKRGMVNVGGLMCITLGVLVLFIGYPVLYGTLGIAFDGIIGD